MKKPEIKEVFDPYKQLNNKKRKNIIVVMPTFNQYSSTRKNIILIKQQTLVPDILIVDNNSNDNTFERLKEEFQDLILIKAKENYGGAGGFYLGQKYAYEEGYEYIILNDNDAYPLDKDLIETLIHECDKDTVVQPFNVEEELDNNFNFWVFHWCCFNRFTFKKVGFVNYKLFLYGDDVEYLLRLKTNKIKTKKIKKRYSHIMKYHYPPTRVYFAIRNELYNQIKYSRLRKKSFISMIVVPLTYYRMHEPTKYKVAKKAIKDLLKGEWNNCFIKRKFNLDVKYKELTKEDFLKRLNHRKITFLEKPSISLILNKYQLKQKYSKFSFLKTKVLVTSALTINIFFFNKVYYVVNFDANKDKVVFFELHNTFKIKLLAIFLLFFYWFYLKFVIFILKFFKKNKYDG